MLIKSKLILINQRISSMENNKEEITLKQLEAFEFLKENGIKGFDVVRIRKIFIDYGILFQNEFKIKKDKFNTYTNVNVKNMGFDNEKDAIFFEHLQNYATEGTSKQDLNTVFSIVNKLLNHKNGWTFNK